MCVCSLDYYEYEQDDRTDEETEPTFSEDEAVSQRGLRRSQSVKITRSKGRKDVRHTHTHSYFIHCDIFSLLFW